MLARGFCFLAASFVIWKHCGHLDPTLRNERELRGRECVSLCSKSKQAKNEEYREAWHLLREASEDSEGTISEVAETGGEDSPAVEAVVSQGPPAGGLGRLEAAMNFFKQNLERK